MAKILHHLGCMKPSKLWDKLPINWCRISSINRSGILHLQTSAVKRPFWVQKGFFQATPGVPACLKEGSCVGNTNGTKFKCISGQIYFTNKDFPEIEDFPYYNHQFGVRSLEVAIIWPEQMYICIWDHPSEPLDPWWPNWNLLMKL